MKKSFQIPAGALQNLLWTTHLLCREVGLDKLRFRSHPGMTFPADEVESVSKLPEEDKYEYEVNTNVGGLGGSSGPLPIWLDELLAFEEPDSAPLGNFLDIFSHRFIRALYGAWIKHRPDFTYLPGAKDRISVMLLSLAGVRGIMKFSGNDFFQKARLCAYIGSMGHGPASAMGLSGMLRDYFKNIPFYVKQFVIQKQPIAGEDMAYLGKNTLLGKNTIIGEQAKNICGKFRVIAGPLTLNSFENFLPQKPGYIQLTLLIKMFTPQHLKWDIALRIKGESIPKLCAGSKKSNPRLGYNTWLVSKPRDDYEVIF